MTDRAEAVNVWICDDCGESLDVDDKTCPGCRLPLNWPETLPDKLKWARTFLNIHGALSDSENERIKRRIVRTIAALHPKEGTP